jgi:hypothetical protein
MKRTNSMHGETRNVHKILVGKLDGRHHLGDFGISGRIVLNGS